MQRGDPVFGRTPGVSGQTREGTGAVRTNLEKLGCHSVRQLMSKEFVGKGGGGGSGRGFRRRRSVSWGVYLPKVKKGA